MVKELQFISQLSPADVIVAKKRNGFGRILNHFIVYVGNETFIGNLQNGVKIIYQKELSELLIDYEPVKIRYFVGTEYQRKNAIKRAYSRINEKYNLLTFNCEHFANWVQKGKDSSIQVTITLTILLFGLTYKLISTGNKKK